MEDKTDQTMEENTEYFDPDAVAHARSKIPDEDTMTELSDFFKNFGDSTRIKIVSALMAGELCVADIAEVLEISASAISHQLRILRQAKIVRYRRVGKQIYYSIEDNHVGILYTVGMEHIQEGR
ncbi:MAG: ArsR/SmtB family transcription factor [Treponema sp.]|uniref:ArsR/SmtB family transcription factor n=1 Tax=Treponema sp. TaxID=166 RepID=UPI003FA27D09